MTAHPLSGVELVLFDLDGTLVDSVPSLAHAVDQLLLELGRPAAGEAKVRQWVGNGAPMLIARALSDDREVAADLDPQLQQQALQRFLEHYDQCADRDAQVYPGVIEALAQMQQRGLQLAVVTNKPERFVPDLLRSLELDRFFSLLVGGDSLVEKKPHPLPLQHCLEYFGFAPGQALMVGDSAADIGAARAAGIGVAAVSYGYSYPQPVSAYQPDWLVDSLTELL